MIACSVVINGYGQLPSLDSAAAHIAKGELTAASEMIENLPVEVKQMHWFSVDSLNMIISRLRYDFSLTPSEGIAEVLKKKPATTIREIADWIDAKYIETATIDGKEMWFRKAVRNLWLLNPEFQVHPDTVGNYEHFGSTLYGWKEKKSDKNRCHDWHRATIKFELDVDANVVPAGDTVKAWLPIPLATVRQRNFKMLSTSSDVVYSKGSAHNTVFMTAVAQKDKPTHFEILFRYDVAAQNFPLDYILEKLKPYNTDSDLYKEYTKADGKHVVINDRIKKLAECIVGTETNPVKKASLIYDWIVSRFPWAGARDYGTIPNIPDYVLDIHHGDCGQVALLYISLVRAVGVPARWESGWMLHPWENNYHDWAETYFEGIGWVPTDVSFGRNDDPAFKEYYKTGTDVYRFASNCDYSEKLYPEKKYLRTDPMDFQAGEAEWRNGNIEGTDYSSKLTVVSFEPIK